MTSYANYVLDYFENLSYEAINLEDYNHIPSVKFRGLIYEICKGLIKIGDIKFCGCTIILPNGLSMYISSHPLLDIAYFSSGLERANDYSLKAAHWPESYFFPRHENNRKDWLANVLNDVLESRLTLYNSYCLIRRCDECTIIFGVAHDYPHNDVYQLYNNTVNDIECFIIDYLDALMPIYTDNLPLLKYSRFSSDKFFRSHVIKNRIYEPLKSHILTHREKECLHWISRGKTSAEVAILMEISEFTVVEYKKAIMYKLNANNMVHAVRQAMCLKQLI